MRLPIDKGSSDFGNLNETFNTMTTELRSQRDELILARDAIDARRRFTEAMLQGVSAGVIGVDETGEITLANPSVLKILGLAERDLLGEDLDKVLPEIASLVEEADKLPRRIRKGRSLWSAMVSNSPCVFASHWNAAIEDESHSYVVTLDDITSLSAPNALRPGLTLRAVLLTRSRILLRRSSCQRSDYADAMEKDCRG